MQKLILVKLGGSVITKKDKPFTARPKTILRLAKEIKSASKYFDGKILIGHGGGSFPHVPAAKYKTHLGLINKKSVWGFAQTSKAAVDINRIVLKEFLKAGLPAVSFSPMSFIFALQGRPKKILTEPIDKALKLGLFPIVFGDVILDEGNKGFSIYSGEKILDCLAQKFSKSYKITKVIMVGDTDGIYDNKGKTFRKITHNNLGKLKEFLGDPKGVDVTGGMLHKIEEMFKISRKIGIKTQIINGNKVGELKKSILGQKTSGTFIYW